MPPAVSGNMTLSLIVALQVAGSASFHMSAARYASSQARVVRPAPQANGFVANDFDGRNSAAARAAARAAAAAPPESRDPEVGATIDQAAQMRLAQPSRSAGVPASVTADQATVQLAVDAAVAAAAAVLRSADGDINVAAVAPLIHGFSAKMHQLLAPSSGASGLPASVPAPVQAPSSVADPPISSASRASDTALDGQSVARVFTEFVRG